MLKAGVSAEPDALSAGLVTLIRDRIGAVAALRRVDVVADLPKTRSGKILRKPCAASPTAPTNQSPQQSKTPPYSTPYAPYSATKHLA